MQLVKGSHGSKWEDIGLFRALCLAVRLAARLIAPLHPECTHGGEIGAERLNKRNDQQQQRGKCPHPRNEQQFTPLQDNERNAQQHGRKNDGSHTAPNHATAAAVDFVQLSPHVLYALHRVGGCVVRDGG